MATNFSFSNWPPALSPDQLEALTLYATTYALSHGLLYLPTTLPQPPTPTSAIHAPLAIVPSPFPRRLFQLARRLQRTYNFLYARIALDEEFLDEVMGAVQGVGMVDEFVGRLWAGWKQLRDEGIVQIFPISAGDFLTLLPQPLHLGLFRSDYLLHSAGTDLNEPLSLKQVEFNTISSSFGPLSERTAALHKYLYASTQYYNASPHLNLKNFPSNNTTAGLAEGLVEAHKAYNVPGSRILFVVQAGERNVFDQRLLEYALLEHSIHVVRQTFDELADSARLDPITRVLRIYPGSGFHSVASPTEISTVYFRAGYTPTDFPTSAQYETRFLLERSRAIKCPSIALQLAGGKKVQEVLTKRGVLERFLCDQNKWGNEVFGADDVDEVRASWMKMWGLDDDDGREAMEYGVAREHSSTERSGTRKARELASSLVLKPQREGGGNNVYKEAIPAFLDELPLKERQAWIAMELIHPPEGVGSYLVRAGAGTEGAVKTGVVSELGIFGWALFGPSLPGVKEKEVGWLVRTKGKDSNEGGVATGFSVLDSLILVDD